MRLTTSPLQVSGYNPHWNDPRYTGFNPKRVSPQSIDRLARDVKELFQWQAEAYKDGKDERFFFVAAFCGSGKSIVHIALAIHDVIASKWKQKQLIVVPQSHIAASFSETEELEYITVVVEGVEYTWKTNHNFCNAKSKDVKIRLKAWLLEDGESLSRHFRGQQITGLNAVTSHQALGLVWDELSDFEKKIAIRNLTLRVDEAHHIRGVFDPMEEGLTSEEKTVMEMEANNLGKICQYIFNSEEKTSKIHLTTATPYRGDRRFIISPAVRDCFKIYFLDWIKHFQTLGIEDFYLEYEEYVGDPIAQVIEKIKREPSEKHMVVIPSSTHKWRHNGRNELQDLLEALYVIIPRERVLDLVTKSTQKKNKALLLKEPKVAGKDSKYDVIVTCMLGREGTDWCPCNRLHNTSCENSITLAVQTIGRPFRRFAGKRHVRIYCYVPKFAAPKEGMTKRDLLSDRTNALLVCMQLDEMNSPILVPKIPNKTGVDGDSVAVMGANESGHTSLAEVFGEHYQDVKQRMVESLEFESSDGLVGIAEKIMNEYNITENRENIRYALVALGLRALSPKLKEMGISVEFVREEGFDKIVERFDLKNRSIFFGSYTKEDWEEIRRIIKNGQHVWEETCRQVVNEGIAKIVDSERGELYEFLLVQRRDYKRKVKRNWAILEADDGWQQFVAAFRSISSPTGGTPEQNKKRFLEMAIRGDPRPTRENGAGKFWHYTTPGHQQYDKLFHEEINKIAPHWKIKKRKST